MAATISEETRIRPAWATPPWEPGPAADVADPEAAILKADADQSETPDVAQSFDTSGTSAPAPAPALTFSVDETGAVVVQDALGAAYGVGPTPADAVRDFFRALDDRLRVLRARRGALHARLAEQLQELERLFPGR